MNTKQRKLALKLLEKQGCHPDYAKKIGVKVKMIKNKKIKKTLETVNHRFVW